MSITGVLDPPLSGYPQPRSSWQVHPAVNATLTVLFFLILAGFAVYATRLWRCGHGPAGLLLLAGGAAAFAIEPILDALGMCFHPRNQPIVWDILGRPDPLFCLPIYMFWTGGCALLVWRALENGMGRRHLWSFYGAAFLGDVLLETVCLKLNAWYYYGNQPLRILDFPWWYASANAGFAVIGGVVLYVLGERLRGWGSLIAVCVPGISIIVSYAISAWPTWAALNTTLPTVAIQPAGLATVVLGLGGVWFFSVVHELAEQARAVPSWAAPAGFTGAAAPTPLGWTGALAEATRARQSIVMRIQGEMRCAWVEARGGGGPCWSSRRWRSARAEAVG